MENKKEKLIVGFVTTASPRWPLELPKNRHLKYSKWLKENFYEVSIVRSDTVVVSDSEIKRTIEKFRMENVDLVIMLIGAFTGDNNCTLFAEKLKVPIILWALPEPEFNGNRLISNALVAATMNQSALKRLGLKSQFIYGEVNDERCVDEISGYIRMYLAYKKLRNTYLGLIGYRPTGFYSSQFDEALICKTFGLIMEEYDLIHLINISKNMKEKDVKKDMENFASSIKCVDLSKEYLENHSRLYLGVKKIIEDNNFDGLALRCWPELGFMHYTPCAVISRLADEGVIIGCESDVDATISMLIGNYLTGKMVFMSDLVNINEKENTALFWHCGQAGRKLHDERNSYACNHSLAGEGVVIGGTLKEGPVTVYRVSKIDNTYKLFIAKGKAIPTEKVVKGVMVNVRMEKPVRDIIYTIAEKGVAHHYIIVWEDAYRDIKLFSNNLDMEVIEVNEF
jgi:L-fucose isomerase-like protein